jgi:excisionase family DNA binding protein
MSTTLDEVKFVSPKSASKITGAGLRCIQYKIESGELRSIKWGRKRLIPISALAESLGVAESELRPNAANVVTTPAIPLKDLENVPHAKKRTAPGKRRPVPKQKT